MERIKALLARPEPVRWVFAGDSITHGAAHTVGWRDYTELFTERVKWELKRVRDVIIKTGVSGWTIGHFWDDIEWSGLQFRPDCVSMMFGMNDCVRGPENLPFFRETYLRSIDRIRTETGAAILLHTPNWTLPRGGETRVANLPAYREAILEIAREADAPVVDHFPIWVEADPSGALDHWMGHGCHPNEYGMRVLAHTIFRALDIWDDASWTCQLTVPRYP
jgi:lysophospholipase L1-like esterase